MRVLFAGSPPFATPVLEALLASSHPVVGILTQPSRPKGRGRKADESEIERLAARHGIPVSTPENVNDDAAVEWCIQRNAEVFAVASYGQLLKERLLTFAPFGALNVHASVLPRHRGASPIAAAIRQGDPDTGVSIQRMVKKLDAGPVCAARRTAIGAQETAGDLTARLAILGGELLVATLDSLAKGAAHFEDQDETLATYAPKLSKDSGRIEWAQPATSIERLIRAMNPWPGAFSRLHRDCQAPGAVGPADGALFSKGVRLKILRAEAKESVASPYEPGTILDLPADRSSSLPKSLGVATSEGLLTILELQPEGGNVMGGADFLRGQRLSRGAFLQS